MPRIAITDCVFDDSVPPNIPGKCMHDPSKVWAGPNPLGTYHGKVFRCDNCGAHFGHLIPERARLWLRITT